jgi:hypothetical protein
MLTGSGQEQLNLNVAIEQLRLLGSLERLMAVYDHVRETGMGAYGGGQYELGPGRGHIQYLASMFHPDAPNDTSPVDFHRPPHAGAPSSPLRAAPAATGFRWES